MGKPKIEERTIALAPKRLIDRELVLALNEVKRSRQRSISHRPGDCPRPPPTDGMTASFTLRFRKQYQNLSAEYQAKFDK